MSQAEPRKNVRAGILVTGTEVLTATIRDENGPWLSEQLLSLGVELVEILVVADHRADLLAGLEHMRDLGIDLIITTGGLGPTADDLTADVVAGFTGRPLALDSEMESRISAILARYTASTSFAVDHEAIVAANRKQAMVPAGAVALNPIGTAPGLIVPGPDGIIVLVLPGPPRELRPMWEDALPRAPLSGLLARATPLLFYRLRMFGTPESELASTLRAIEADGVPLDELEVTTCLRRGEVEIDVRYREETTGTAEALRRELAERHSRTLYSSTGESVDAIVAGLLAGRRLAVAESCSSGLLAARITNIPGASDYFAGGVVTYSNQAKVDLLGVDPAAIKRYGAVSPEVASQMAAGVLQRFDADVAVSITGIAGPGGGSEEKPVGFVCFEAVTADGRAEARSPVIPGGRRDIRDRSALVAMHLLRVLLS